jgi:hypothetical protein
MPRVENHIGLLRLEDVNPAVTRVKRAPPARFSSPPPDRGRFCPTLSYRGGRGLRGRGDRRPGGGAERRWAAGDIAEPAPSIASAIASGSRAAAAITHVVLWRAHQRLTERVLGTTSRAVWQNWHSEGDRFVAAGERSSRAEISNRRAGNGSGGAVDQPIAIVWTLRDGLIWRGEAFLDQQQALKGFGGWTGTRCLVRTPVPKTPSAPGACLARSVMPPRALAELERVNRAKVRVFYHDFVVEQA